MKYLRVASVHDDDDNEANSQSTTVRRKKSLRASFDAPC